MAFFGGFVHAPPHAHSLTHSFYGKWKVFGWYISLVFNVFQPAENITQLSYIKAAYTRLLHLVNTKVRLLSVLLKNLDLHSFLETVIRLCEDRDYVTFIAFFVFLYTLPPAHLLIPSFLGIWKVLKWYISASSFMCA